MDPTSTLKEREFAGYACWGLLSRVCLSRWRIDGSNIHIEGARICYLYLLASFEGIPISRILDYDRPLTQLYREIFGYLIPNQRSLALLSSVEDFSYRRFYELPS